MSAPPAPPTTAPPTTGGPEQWLADDAAARLRIRDDLDATLVVEAAAGTGKTTALVGRLVSLVAHGRAELRAVVAVTFTEAAAGELKLRLRTALEAARAASAERPLEASPVAERLDRALVQLEEARIGTIHGFCADLLRERPVEAGVDPLFSVASEDEARALFDRAFDTWFQSTLEAPTEGVRRTLRRRKRGRHALGPEATLREAAFSLLEHRDYPAPWRRAPWDRRAEIDRLLALLAEAAAVESQADDRDDWLRKSLAPVAAFVREHARREAQRASDVPRDDDGLEAELVHLARGEKYGRSWTWTGGRREWYAAPVRDASASAAARAGLARRDVVALRDQVKAALDAFVGRAGQDLAAVLHAELAPLAEAYERLLQRAGKLDFLDLLVRARALLADRAVRGELQRRFSHYFVDEFQDTDPLQADILCLLAADDPDCDDPLTARPVPGKLFLVGDPKQSIYRFRRADVALYAAVKARLAAAGADVVYLSQSFRAVPALQTAINAAFASAMGDGATEVGEQARYVPLAPARPAHPGQPALVALPAPRIYSDFAREPTRYVIEASYPDAACAFVDWLLRASGYTVEERGARVPVAARHVCFLFRRMQSFGEDLSRAYVRGLEARQIPHVLVGGRSFHDREEVEAMRLALTAIEWPDDSLAVYATLRGPLFSLPDDLLLRWAARDPSGGPEASAGATPRSPSAQAFHLRPGVPLAEALASGDDLRPVAEALDLLGALHRRRNRRPVADTLAELLAATRAHANFASWAAGEQALSNVLRTLELARRFEARTASATSFRAFVEWLELAAERGGAAEAPVVEDGADGVRLLSVHKAKGLEFPVVVLVDPTAPLSPSTPSHWVDHARRRWVERIAGCVPIELEEHAADVLARETEEAVRLAYVAATRARDLLVVPAVGEGRLASWVTPLDAALTPKERRNPRPAEGCPPFATETVLARPESLGPTDQVRPGAHDPVAGTHEVVWWDPRALELDREVDAGLRHEAVLHPHDDPRRGEAERAGHARFVARRAAALEQGSAVAHPARSVTAMAQEAATAPGFDGRALRGVELLQVRRPSSAHGGPGGKRFGTLVHAVLSTVPLGPRGAPGAHARDRAEVDAHCRAHGRLLGATSDEVAAAAERVLAALAHPVLVRAAEVEHRREVAVTLPEPDGQGLLEGVIDLCYLDGAQWVVVDYKTDRALGDAVATYATQLQAYGRAVTAATGHAARLVLLSV